MTVDDHRTARRRARNRKILLEAGGSDFGRVITIPSMFDDGPLSFDLDAEAWKTPEGSAIIGDAVSFLAWARTPHRAELSEEYFMLGQAARLAVRSGCARSRRGVVVWSKVGEEYSVGTNGPPPGYECSGSDVCKKTCGQHCEHAEIAALMGYEGPKRGVNVLHVKVDGDGVMVPSGPPSCLPCAATIARLGWVSMIWLLLDVPGGPVLLPWDPDDFYAETLKQKPTPGLRVLKEAW